MSDSMFGSLVNMMDKRSVGEVAHALGQPEHSVALGLESSIAALLAGMASKSQDPAAMQKVLDTGATAGPVSLSQIVASVADPSSPLMAAGKRILPALFGGGETAVTSGISRTSGLSSGAVSTLMTMAAPLVMSFLSKRVRDGGLTMSGLGALLQGESAAVRNALPSGMSELFRLGTPPATTAAPVVAQAMQREKSHNWLPALAIAGLGMVLLWFLGHPRRPSIATPVPSAPIESANRLAEPPVSNVLCSVPSSVDIPANGVAARLLAFVQNPDMKPDTTTWFTADQMIFDTGSAKLRRESQAQLDNIAAVLTNCPSVHIDVAGYTDDVGSAESNLRLSRSRANAVIAQLVTRGVSPDRLHAAGYGEEGPVADNTLEQGRVQNRRAAVRVTQK